MKVKPASESKFVMTIMTDDIKSLIHRAFLEGLANGLHTAVELSRQQMHGVVSVIRNTEDSSTPNLRPLS